MANRINTFLLKRSNIPNKIPALSGLTLGELALNTSDAKLYTLYTGGFSGATEVREIGWDKLSVSGGTLYGNLLVNGSVSATTFYGDGSYLTNISTTDYYVTGGTFSGTTLILNRQNGSVTITGFTASNVVDTYVTGFTYNDGNLITLSQNQGLSALTINLSIMSGLTVNNGLTANTLHNTYLYDRNNSLGTPGQVLSITSSGIEWVNVTGTSINPISPNICNVETTTTSGLEYKKIATISGFTEGSYIIKSYLTSFSGDSKYGFWERTLGVVTTGGTPTIVQTTEDFDSYIQNFLPSQIVYTPIVDGIDIYISGLTGENLLWTSYYDVKGQNCGATSSSDFTGNTSATCISDIFVSNIHSCSPLNINPNDEGNVYFGSTSDVTIDLSGNSTKLIVNGSTSATTFYGSGSGLNSIPFSGVTDLSSQLDLKTDLTLFSSHTGNTSNPHQTSFSQLISTAHTHTISDVINLQSSLDSKFNVSGGTVNGNVIINGNVQILGSATTINTQSLTIEDNVITLNSNYTGGTPFFGHSGVEVLRGSGTTAAILWEEQNLQWEAGLHGSTKRVILEGDNLSLLISGHTHPISEVNGLQTSLDSKFNVSGGTITNNIIVSGSVSATTFYGNGQYLTGLVTNDYYVTGGTFSGTTLILNRQNGSVTITGFTASSGGGTFTGGTVAGATNFTGGLTANTINTPITNTQVIYSNGGTLTGSTNLTWVNSATTLTINGTLEATSKSFSIPHPTKEGKKLVYGSLEGPENGVYHRGKLYKEDIILLPEYWSKLVDKDSVTVHLTPIGKHQDLFVKEILEDRVIIGIEGGLFTDKTINCFYVVYGERKDINKLEVER